MRFLTSTGPILMGVNTCGYAAVTVSPSLPRDSFTGPAAELAASRRVERWGVNWYIPLTLDSCQTGVLLSDATPGGLPTGVRCLETTDRGPREAPSTACRRA